MTEARPAQPQPVTEQWTIAGPAGDLEARLELAFDEPASMALVCHPHPLHQGTMDNKVVFTLARSFSRLGAVAVRFNFRGVGKSAGSYAEGVGETDDALAVAESMRNRWPELDLYLAGFSFGAMVAIAAAARLSPRGLITVAPPMSRVDPGLPPPRCPWLVVQGQDDDVVAADEVAACLRRYEPAPELRLLPGVGHFFHGRLTDLEDAVAGFVGASAGTDRGN